MDNRKTGIFIQARSNSSRLKNKIYAGLPEKESVSQLAHIYNRLQNVGADVVSIIIPDTDTLLQEWCMQNKMEYFMGSELNVRERYQKAAIHYQVDWIARATGDNPCVDHEIARQTIAIAIKDDLDLFSFKNLPLGMAIEVFKAQALSQTLAGSQDEQEHVSLHIKHNPSQFNFRHDNHYIMKEFEDLVVPRMTVDTAEDLFVVRQVFMHLGYQFGVEDVMRLSVREPEIFHANKNITQRTFLIH